MIVSQLRRRLKALLLKSDPNDENDRSRLLNDTNILICNNYIYINTSKHCLEVCRVASEVSNQKNTELVK